MNDEKPVAQVSPLRGSKERADRPDGAEQKGSGSEAMHTDIQGRRTRGRLSRDDQRRLGDILQRVYDDVVKQGVPDRFIKLMEQMDQGSHGSDGHSPRGLQDNSGSAPTVEAHGYEKPKDQN
jgi:anti-sigma factor NepR-like protein